ncbi:MAG: hypothetical protein J6Y28_01430 [Acholeplasmatales bacterium]|nr:hypothetical protein [Acholeplasmatales bacterium]
MARIINQNNEVIATKNKDNKVTVSKTSFIVGLALLIAATAVIVVIILFLTQKTKNEEKSKTTPLLEYIDNYSHKTKSNYRIKLLSGLDVNEIENWAGECYILIYDTSWKTEMDSKTDEYKSYTNLDAFLTGSKKENGDDISFTPMLDVLQQCGKDIMFYVVDFQSIKKSDDDLAKNPEYFKMHDGKTSMQSLNAPMLFHYIDGEKYDGMNDPDLKIADGNVKVNQWGSIIKGEVSYLYSLTNNTESK